MWCPNGATVYEYDNTSVDLNSITISQDENLQNVTNALMRPSSGLTSEKETTLRLKLTPSARKSKIHISLVAENAKLVTIQADNQNITNEVSSLSLVQLITINICIENSFMYILLFGLNLFLFTFAFFFYLKVALFLFTFSIVSGIQIRR